MKYGPCMRRKNLAGKQVLFTLILITIFILQSVSVNAENSNLQDNNNFNEKNDPYNYGKYKKDRKYNKSNTTEI